MVAANKAVKLAPLSSQAWNTKGRAELNRFEYDDAIEAFSKAVELDADNVWAWNNLGYTELQLKKYDEAVEHLTEATRRRAPRASCSTTSAPRSSSSTGSTRHAPRSRPGGKLGSQGAMASRKRLEGVTSIAIISNGEKPDVKPDVTHTFDNSEGPMLPDTDDTTGDDATDTGDTGDDGDQARADRDPVDVQPKAVEPATVEAPRRSRPRRSRRRPRPPPTPASRARF